MDQRLQEYKDQTEANYNNLATRLERLETNQRKSPYHVGDNESRANNRSPSCRQAQPYPTKNQDAQYIKCKSGCSFLRRMSRP